MVRILGMLPLNGGYDFLFPLNLGTSQRPLFELLGSPPPDKRHVVFDSGHQPPNDLLTREVLDWLDRYLAAPDEGRVLSRSARTLARGEVRRRSLREPVPPGGSRGTIDRDPWAVTGAALSA
jgi:hypothetical protein